MQANRDSIMKPAAAAWHYRGWAKANTGRREIYGADCSVVGMRFMFRS
jgi:hypothetical protein